jgi:uncharacterized membrane protein
MSSLSVRTVILISCAVLLAYLGALRLEGPQGGVVTHRWLSDDDDRGVYFERAQFYPKGLTPFRDVFSEYPTLGTFAFVTPYLLPGGSSLTREAYMFRWSCVMAAVYALTIALVALFRQGHGLSAAPALLLLGPSALYFGLMRFDILCACVVCLSLMAFARERYLLAYVLLAVATLVKWYPAVVFPVYLAFHFSRDPTRFRTHAMRYAIAYGVTVLAIVGFTIAYVTWDGFLAPYRYHGSRGAQYFNPYWVLARSHTALGLDAAWMGPGESCVPGAATVDRSAAAVPARPIDDGRPVSRRARDLSVHHVRTHRLAAVDPLVSAADSHVREEHLDARPRVPSDGLQLPRVSRRVRLRVCRHAADRPPLVRPDRRRQGSRAGGVARRDVSRTRSSGS